MPLFGWPEWVAVAFMSACFVLGYVVGALQWYWYGRADERRRWRDSAQVTIRVIPRRRSEEQIGGMEAEA